MSVLSEMNVKALSNLEESKINIIKLGLAREFWKWYMNHKEDEILSISVLFISVKKVRVKNIKFVFELLFGHMPGDLANGSIQP